MPFHDLERSLQAGRTHVARFHLLVVGILKLGGVHVQLGGSCPTASLPHSNWSSLVVVRVGDVGSAT